MSVNDPVAGLWVVTGERGLAVVEGLSGEEFSMWEGHPLTVTPEGQSIEVVVSADQRETD